MNMSFLGDMGLWNIISFILFFILILFGSRLMFYQMFSGLERSATLLETFAANAKRTVIRKISKNPSRELKESVNSFTDFFSIDPVSTDPYGVMKKIEHVYTLSEKRFHYFVDTIAPKLDEESKANLVMGMSGAVSLNQIAKIVRHFVELARKTKNLQYVMVLQMQLPMIERISKALVKGTEALTNGWTIGDGIGPLTVANMIGDAKTRDVEEETVMAVRKIKGRKILLIKAKGPGGRLGKLGKTIEKITKREKIAKIITIDAAGKLEGEKSGKTAEGIGVAIGGIGIDRSYIENIATNKNIPLDTVVVKMSNEEAIMPMKRAVLNSIYKVTKSVEDSIERTKEKGSIIVIGVGNCSGIGNDKRAAQLAEDQIKKIETMMKNREKEERKEFRIYTEE